MLPGLFSCCGALAVGIPASVAAVGAVGSALQSLETPERRRSYCGSRTWLIPGTWDSSSQTRDLTHVSCIDRRILFPPGKHPEKLFSGCLSRGRPQGALFYGRVPATGDSEMRPRGTGLSPRFFQLGGSYTVHGEPQV